MTFDSQALVDGPVLWSDSVSAVHIEVVVGGRAVPVCFVARRESREAGTVEVWFGGEVVASLARGVLAAFFDSPEKSPVPILRAGGPTAADVSITLPGLREWRLSPSDRRKLRELLRS